MSILHLRSTSDPWEVGSQGSSYSVGSNKSQSGGKGKSSGNARGSYTRGTSIPSLKRHDTTVSATASTSSLKQHRQDSHSQASEESKRKIFLLLLYRAPFLKSRVTPSTLYLSLRRMKNFKLLQFSNRNFLKIRSLLYNSQQS